nr:hypothetical protein [Fusarium asiaticum vivivirus 1]WRW55963.1 hypothetical protein [Fusarium asiaticum vivivirus 1]
MCILMLHALKTIVGLLLLHIMAFLIYAVLYLTATMWWHASDPSSNTPGVLVPEDGVLSAEATVEITGVDWGLCVITSVYLTLMVWLVVNQVRQYLAKTGQSGSDLEKQVIDIANPISYGT